MATTSDSLRRVVLRLRVNEFENECLSAFNAVVIAYLGFAGRATTDEELNRHYVHIEPFQDPELHQTSFHMILDIEKYAADNPDFKHLQHEIYRIRREDGSM